MPAETAAALQRMSELSPAASEALSFPLSMGELRQEADRGGAPCTAVDCIINAEVVRPPPWGVGPEGLPRLPVQSADAPPHLVDQRLQPRSCSSA